jgi:phage terminase large subunit GpA-like protein
MTAAYASPAQYGYRAMARALAPRKPLTVSQWADAERRTSSKGSAIVGQWVTDRNPPLREPMDCLSARSGVRDVVLMFPIQFGKALALDTPIPTPSGWTTMGDISPGDVVFGDDGRQVRVIAVSEVFNDHPCYLVRFSDGSEVVADAGHRWQVVDLQRRNEARKELKRRAARDADGTVARKRGPVSDDLAAHRMVLTTDALAGTFLCGEQARYAVEVTQPLELPTAVLPLAPYLLGLWLGDGHSHYGAITSMDAEIVQAFSAYDPKPHTHQSGGQALTYGLRNGFSTLLRKLGVLKNKHVPALYLRASREQRLDLLQGLMDTDGHAGQRGHVEITSSYPALVDGIVELVCSLGFKPTVTWRATKGKPSARITFAAYQGSNVFRLPRKRLALLEGPSTRGSDSSGVRYITSVEPVATVPTRCIAVDNDSHLFLCSRSMIPTHNTEVAINALGYAMDHDPCPVMVCLPGEVSQQKWVSQKLNPAVEESPAIKRALTSVSSRDSSNTRTFKDFAGGQLYIEHAGSPSRLKSTTVRKLLVDEVDEFAANLTGGDDPVEMLEGRTSAFPSTYQRLFISTPQIKGISRIEQLYNKSDQRRYHVPCPHCGHMQPLMWAGLHWSTDGSQVWYVCQDCGAHIDEHHKTAMIAAGQWVPENPGSKVRGYHINCLYYQFGLGPRWVDLVERWREVQADPARLKTFVNDRLAEPWEDAAMRAVKHNAIADRAEPYALRTAPHGALVITAGVDTQDNRLAVQIVAWGRGLAFWVLDYVELPGDPADDTVWASLTQLLNTPIQHASGALMHVEAYANDAGGHRTEAVKNYVRQRRVRRPMAIFGAIPNNAPVLSKGKLQDVNWRGQYDKKGVMTYHVGTVGIKHWLYSRLSTDAEKQPDARQTHFSDELPPEYFQGLVSETYNPAKNRFEKRRGARNEALDTFVYAYAAAHHPEVRLHRLTKADWDRIESTLAARAAKNSQLQVDKNSATIIPVAVSENHQTTQAVNELPQPPQTQPPPTAKPERASKLATLPRRGGGWIKRW